MKRGLVSAAHSWHPQNRRKVQVAEKLCREGSIFRIAKFVPISSLHHGSGNWISRSIKTRMGRLFGCCTILYFGHLCRTMGKKYHQTRNLSGENNFYLALPLHFLVTHWIHNNFLIRDERRIQVYGLLNTAINSQLCCLCGICGIDFIKFLL